MKELDESFAKEAANEKAAFNREPHVSSAAVSAPVDHGGRLFEAHHLLDYVRIVHKRRWLASASFVTLVGLVAVYSFTATPVYEATAKLLIEADNPNVVSFQEVIDEAQTRADYYQTQYNILQSRSLARTTLTELELWKHPDFSALDQPSLMSRALSSVRNLFGAGGGTSGAPVDESTEQANAINTLLGNLAVAPVRNSRVVDLKYRSSNPNLARVIANAHAHAYISKSLDFRLLSTKEAADWLSDRMSEQRKQVAQAEAALQRFRETNDAISVEDRENIVVQKLTELNTAVTRAKTIRLEKEAVYSQLRSIQDNPAALDTFPAILANEFIQRQKAELSVLQRQEAELSQRLGERHPDMQKARLAITEVQLRLQGEIAKVVQAVRNDFQAAQMQETSLVRALDEQKAQALSMNRKAIEYSVLDRDVASSRQIYDSLMQRAKETGVSAELKSSNIRIVDEAELPGSPVSPRITMNLIVGVLGGLLLGIGLAFFVEYLDNRIKTPDEIRKHLGLPVLGFLPLLRSAPTGPKSQPLISGDVPPIFSESLRSVRSNLHFSTASDGCQSVVVTSTGPGEGKTVVACNVAAGLAQTGLRVLLIDADMRRPAAHVLFGMKEEPGLSNLMVGTTKASDAVRTTLVKNLWVMTAGRIPPNPSELLGSLRFKQALNAFTGHFDWIIIDTPPIMAVTDSSLVANAATGVLFVIGAEMTSRHQAKLAVETLEAARGKFFGAVLNQMDIERQGYYYSAYYRREYGNYYLKKKAG